MKRFFQLLLFISILTVPRDLRAQSDELSYTEEFTYAINFNTKGGMIGGLNFKWAKAKGPKQFQSFGIELVNIKHSKEYRLPSQETGNSFIGFKTHYLFSLRPFYGREFTILRKAAEEGVFVNLIVAGGPSLGIRKPYYVLYRESQQQDSPYSSIPYTKGADLNQINGVGSFSDGLNNMTYTLGIHGKLGISFEFGQIKSSIAGLEVGILAEKFTKTQEILAFAPNQSFFSSAYILLYFGKKY